jgi:glycosyltransferase involved in cell wall biosynthesis
MKLTIGIVCSNDHLISKCLKSIPADTDIIAVLNYPDKYVENVCKKDKRVSIVRCDERNLGKLRQLAVDNCKTPAICFIDSDCVLEPNVVETVEKELNKYYAVNIPVRYDYYNLGTKTVSKCRLFNTPDELLFMPFAFRLSLQRKIGSLFDERLYWGEDTDQRLRMNAMNIEYGISNSIVHHKALTIKEDAKSSFRLGRGTYIQVKNGIVKPRSLIKDLSIIHEIKNAHKCHKYTGSFLAGLYHFFIWRPAYKLGYYNARRKDK